LQAASSNDVLGVQIGMEAEKAFTIWSCSNEKFEVTYVTDPIASLPPMPDGSLPRTGVSATGSGENSASAYLMGMTGKERVIAVQRDVAFEAGAAPDVASLVASLSQKYGLVEDLGAAGQSTKRSIVFSSGGKKLPASSPDFVRCSRVLGWNNTGQFVSEGDCGLTINYFVDRRSDDPNKASRLYVVIVDQDRAIAATQKTIRDIQNFRANQNGAGQAPSTRDTKVPAL
jgi:hypothetical protein